MDLPPLSSSFDPWGPPSAVPKALRFNEVPYAPFSKGDKLGRAADWAAENKEQKDMRKQQYGRGYRDPYHAYGASAASSFFTSDETDATAAFSVVDSTKQAQKPRQQHAILKRGGVAGGVSGPGGPGGAGGVSAVSGGPGAAKTAAAKAQQSATARGGAGAGGARNVWGRRNWRDWDKPQRVRDPSVKIASDWELIQTIGFNELQKLLFEFRPGSDIDSYGYVHYYNRNLDKPLANVKLEPLDREVYNITTSDDPIIQEIHDKVDDATFFATDSIISLLMCATKTVIPWDIVINKKNGKVFLDKRDGGPLDLVTVDENATDPPAETPDKSSKINSQASLAYEATYINQNFCANAVNESGPKHEFSHPQNPFYSGDDKSAPLLAHGYRYRKFNLADTPEDEPINLVIRTEVDAVQDQPNGALSFVTVKALNEYGGPNGVLEWKTKFNTQRGAIVAAEMKNNLCKLSRWTVQSILAGAGLLKIGFVSRVAPNDNKSHVIVGVLGREPAQFSGQLNLNLYNGWGIVRSVINICSELEDGKYVLLKDPNNPAVKLYKVPQSTFEEAQ